MLHTTHRHAGRDQHSHEPFGIAALRREAVESLALRMGFPEARVKFVEPSAVAGRSLVEIGRKLFSTCGVPTERISIGNLAHGWLHGSTALSIALGVDLAYSSLDLPSLLIDAAEKIVSEVSRASVGQCRQWCRSELADRLEPRDVVVDAAAGLQSTSPGEESVILGGVADGLVDVDLVKYSGRFAVTEEAIINDDTDTLRRAMEAWGTSAGAIDDAAVVTLLTSNPLVYDGTALFSTAHGNLITGAVTATNLSIARRALAAQTNRAGERLNTRAKYLIVPTTLADTAGVIVSDLAGGAAALELVIMPELDENSQTKWYLAGDRLGPRPITCWNLRSSKGPIGVELRRGRSLANDTEILAARYVAGYSIADYRGIICSSGV